MRTCPEGSRFLEIIIVECDVLDCEVFTSRGNNTSHCQVSNGCGKVICLGISYNETSLNLGISFSNITRQTPFHTSMAIIGTSNVFENTISSLLHNRTNFSVSPEYRIFKYCCNYWILPIWISFTFRNVITVINYRFAGVSSW